MKEERRAFAEKLGAQLKEWNVQIALLKAKADTAKAVFYPRVTPRVRDQRGRRGRTGGPSASRVPGRAGA